MPLNNIGLLYKSMLLTS